MKFLLDSNACIKDLNGRAPMLRRRMLEAGPVAVGLCSVVKAELAYGAYRSARPTENLETLHDYASSLRSLPFDDAAAMEYGRIRAALAAIGRPIGPYDMMIAAIAKANDLTLVTNNTREFARIEGLALEDWEAS